MSSSHRHCILFLIAALLLCGGARAEIIPLERRSAWNDWLASPFTAASTYTVCKIHLKLYRVDSPNGNLIASIYSDSSGPSSEIGTQSDAVAASGIPLDPDTETGVDFTGVSADLTSSTAYWVVIERTDIGTGETYWSAEDNSVTNAMMKDDDGSGAWSSASSFVSGRFTLYATA